MATRGERGGKKTRKSKELARQTLAGKHVPSTAPSSKTGLSRVAEVERRFIQDSIEGAASSSSRPSPAVAEEIRAGPSESEFESASLGFVEVAVVAEQESSVSPTKVSSAVVVPVVVPEPGFQPKTPPKDPPPKAKSATVIQEEPQRVVLRPAKVASSTLVVPPPPKKRPVDTSVEPQTCKSKGPAVEFPKRPLERAIQEAWVSVDFNGCANVAKAGDVEVPEIHPYNQAALRDFLSATVDHGVRVGITSYIGVGGPRSQERRASLTKTVREFNASAIDPRCKIGVRIVSGRADKGQFLREAGACIHVDDRLDTLDGVWQEAPNITTFWCTNRPHNRNHQVVRSLAQALDTIRSQRIPATLHQRPFESFWVVP